jgi:hypothetical protein
MRSCIQDWRVKIQTHSPAWQGLFFPLTDNFYRLGQLFSDLASEHFQLIASLASLKKIITPLEYDKERTTNCQATRIMT